MRPAITLLALLTACANFDAEAPPPPPAELEQEEDGRFRGKKESRDEGGFGALGGSRGGAAMEKSVAGSEAPMPASAAAPSMDDAFGRGDRQDKPADGKDKGGEDGESDAPTVATRAWFPETFLFEPALVTKGAPSSICGSPTG
jgi:hypothetical protein